MATIGHLKAILSLNSSAFGRGARQAMQQTAALSVAMRRATGFVRGLAGSLLAATGVGGLGLMIREGFRAGSELDELSKKAGITAARFTALQRSAEQNGLSVGDLSTGLAKMSVNVAKAAAGDKTLKKAFDAVGVSAQSLFDMAPDEQFKMLADAIGSIPNAAARAQAAYTIFGRAGTALIPVFLEGSRGIEESAKRMRGLGLAVSELDVSKIDAAGDAASDLRRVFQGFERQLAIQLAPLIGGIAERMVKFAETSGFAGEIAAKAFHGAQVVMLQFARVLDDITVGMLRLHQAALLTRAGVEGVFAAGSSLATQAKGGLGLLLNAAGATGIGGKMVGEALASTNEWERALADTLATVKAIGDEIATIREGGAGTFQGDLFDWLYGVNEQFGDMAAKALEMRSILRSPEIPDLTRPEVKRIETGGGLRRIIAGDLPQPSGARGVGGAVSSIAGKQLNVLERIHGLLAKIERKPSGMVA